MKRGNFANVPVTMINTSAHSITVQPVSREPISAGPEEATEENTDNSGTNCSSVNCDEAWDIPVTLDHLSSEQQTPVKEMLMEECKAFAQGENDVGCIPSLRIHNTLKDKTPVQKTYISVPKPLHQEVKQKIQNLPTYRP